MKQSDLPESGSNFVDVRDGEQSVAAERPVADIPVAIGQVRAMTVPGAGGERIILSNGPYSGNDVCVVSRRAYCAGPS